MPHSVRLRQPRKPGRISCISILAQGHTCGVITPTRLPASTTIATSGPAQAVKLEGATLAAWKPGERTPRVRGRARGHCSSLARPGRAARPYRLRRRRRGGRGEKEHEEVIDWRYTLLFSWASSMRHQSVSWVFAAERVPGVPRGRCPIPKAYGASMVQVDRTVMDTSQLGATRSSPLRCG